MPEPLVLALVEGVIHWEAVCGAVRALALEGEGLAGSEFGEALDRDPVKGSNLQDGSGAEDRRCQMYSLNDRALRR